MVKRICCVMTEEHSSVGGEGERYRQRERESLLLSKQISRLGFEVTAKAKSQAHRHESALQNAFHCCCEACDKLQKDLSLLPFLFLCVCGVGFFERVAK